MQFPEPLLEPYIDLGDSILEPTAGVVNGNPQAFILPLFAALVISLIVIPPDGGSNTSSDNSDHGATGAATRHAR